MKKPLRVCLVMQGSRKWMGGVEYTKNLILALHSLPQETRKTFEICLFSSSKLESDLIEQLNPIVDRLYWEADVNEKNPSFVDRLQRKIQQTILKNKNNSLNADLALHKFFIREKFDFVYPLFWANFLGKASYRSATWIPDFQHKYLPQFFETWEVKRRDEFYLKFIRNTETVVLSSKSAELDCHKFFPDAIDKTRVLFFKTSIDPALYEAKSEDIQARYCLPDKFFLVSNQFWQHKNHLVIFQALKILQERSIYPEVVLTGCVHDDRCPSYTDTILQSIHQFGIARQIYLLGLIPRSDQIQLMRRSIGIVQPSLFEGWSTVVEDGRCLGKPMILSDISVHLEQNPPNCLFFERESPDSLANRIAQGWNDLVPGPNLEQETIARNNNLMEVQSYGHRFLLIAQDSQL